MGNMRILIILRARRFFHTMVPAAYVLVVIILYCCIERENIEKNRL